MKVKLFLPLVLFLTSCASHRPLVIAHRGASGYLPEHSLPAVSAAHMMNVDFIEQDVVLSKDDIPVVLHDIHLESVTDVEQKFPRRKRKDGHFYTIDFTLQELKSLNLHERARHSGTPVFPERFPLTATGMKIPTLEEEIVLIQGMNKSRQKNIGIYVELKAPEFHRKAGHPMENRVLGVLEKYGYRNSMDNVFLQCFDPKTLKKLRETTQLRLIQLVGMNSWNESGADYEKMMTPEGLKEVSTYADGIGPWLGLFLDKGKIRNKSILKNARDLKLEVHAYTFRADQIPESVADFENLVEIFSKQLGVSGLFTDHPDQVLKILQ